MSDRVTVSFDVRFPRGPRRGTKPHRNPDFPQAGPVPRIARLMALAIHYDHLIRRNVVADQAALARQEKVSRARITQVMDLLNLATDIQEEILFLPGTIRPRKQITERQLRPVVRVLCWKKQRQMWAELKRNRQRKRAR